MATNQTRWVGNLNGIPEPCVRPGLFQDGNTQAIKMGELLELSGGVWIPLDADQSMAGVIAIANEEIKDGDRAGYYEIIIPRPGDLFEYDLDSAGNDGVGTDLFWISSEEVTVTTGSNILGNIAGYEHYPNKMPHLADGDIGNPGTTIKTSSKVVMTITAAASYYAVLQK